ncbi:hypothetical protein NEOLI_002979 [Neolecta irregularis DAH-3]|uniref:BTB domain-containing protein n=1 Tax=Neolecta irregularis (strain DAH-3) TaxID=1198029 RepID=A0A1U7LR58_NEOID|nr:hypothetical protein NEOLI_002979 [Neolecta irregularis DAH-3]|eukprot:OLL25156.1 hypothetical protein NEOLI_002979 [Neolecta irregularis DAH-3]
MSRKSFQTIEACGLPDDGDLKVVINDGLLFNLQSDVLCSSSLVLKELLSRPALTVLRLEFNHGIRLVDSKDFVVASYIDAFPDFKLVYKSRPRPDFAITQLRERALIEILRLFYDLEVSLDENECDLIYAILQLTDLLECKPVIGRRLNSWLQTRVAQIRAYFEEPRRCLICLLIADYTQHTNLFEASVVHTSGNFSIARRHSTFAILRIDVRNLVAMKAGILLMRVQATISEILCLNLKNVEAREFPKGILETAKTFAVIRMGSCFRTADTYRNVVNLSKIDLDYQSILNSSVVSIETSHPKRVVQSALLHIQSSIRQHAESILGTGSRHPSTSYFVDGSRDESVRQVLMRGEMCLDKRQSMYWAG